MPAQPTDLAHAFEQALARVLNSYEFDAAINDYVTAGERIETLTIGNLSETTDEVGVEIELHDEYSGRTETYQVKIARADSALSLVTALPQVA